MSEYEHRSPGEHYADDLAWETHRGRTAPPDDAAFARAVREYVGENSPRAWQHAAREAGWIADDGSWTEQGWRALFPPPVRVELPSWREELHVQGSASPYLRSSGARPSPSPRPDRPDVYRRPGPRDDVERDTLAPEAWTTAEPVIEYACPPPLRRGGVYNGLTIGVDPSMPPGVILFMDAQRRVLAPGIAGLPQLLDAGEWRQQVTALLNPAQGAAERVPWWTFDRRRAEDPERPSAWEQIMTNLGDG